MSNAEIAMGGKAAVTNAEAAVTTAALGWKFIHWGLGLFILGFVVGYVPLLHYILGAQAGDVGPVFLKNMTLWWGCPGVLAEMIVKVGSLGMVAIGLSYVVAATQRTSSTVTGRERMAFTLCAYGLIAEVVTAAVGYVVCNMLWPNFYFQPVQAGKNVWLTVQILSITVYFIGVCYAVAGVRKAAGQR